MQGHTDIQNNLLDVRDRMERAASAASRKAVDIRLIAVSKYRTPAQILEAIEAGQHSFGENTIQDAQGKLALIKDPYTEWHFIGHLQSNKARQVPGSFSWLHTLDSLKLAQALARHVEPLDCVLNTLIQVNISRDPHKFGLPPEAIFEFVDTLLQAQLAGIRLRGLMTIGRQDARSGERVRDYASLRKLGEACARRFGRSSFAELSMGMSDDFEIAIAEGATMVRVGTAIFGPRPATPA